MRGSTRSMGVTMFVFSEAGHEVGAFGNDCLPVKKQREHMPMHYVREHSHLTTVLSRWMLVLTRAPSAHHNVASRLDAPAPTATARGS
eukprot:9477450-Alexandrium_andersonii.AAC.1